MTFERRSGSTRGAAIIEFALGFGLLWLCFSGIWQFGYSLYIYDRVATQVAHGARYASRADFPAYDDTFARNIKNMVVYGNPEGGSAAEVSGLTGDNIVVTPEFNEAGQPTAVTVSVQSFTIDTIFRQIDLSDKPKVTVKYVGQYKTSPGTSE